MSDYLLILIPVAYAGIIIAVYTLINGGERR